MGTNGSKYLFKNGLRLLLLTLLLGPGLFQTIEGQTVYTGIDYSPDSISYFIDKSDLLSIRIYPLAKYNSLKIKGDFETMRMQPNGSGSLGFGFNYKRLGLGISVGFPTSAKDNEKFGKSKRFDMQMSYYGKKLAIDGFFQNFEGYYLDNPNSITTWNEENYPQNGDLRVSSLGGTFHYIFNSDKYSYKAAYLRNQIQKMSAGSFIAGLFAFFDEVISDNGLVPESLPASIRESADIKNFSTKSVGITGGYTYTFVLKGNFFINLGFAPGIGYRNFSVESLDGSMRHTNKFGFQVQSRIAMGYEFNRIYLGATSSTIVRNFHQDYATVNFGTGQIRFIIGARFDVSKKATK